MRLSNRGVSLIEVVIAMGLMGVMATGFMKINSSQSKQINQIRTSFEVNESVNHMRMFLLDGSSCQNTLNGLNFGVMPLTLTSGAGIRNKQGNLTRFSVGSVLIPNRLQISQMRIENSTLDTTTPPSSGAVNMIVTFQKLGNFSGSEFFERELGVYLKTNTSNNVDECYSALGNAVATAVTNAKRDMCQQLGGSFDTTTENCSSIDVKPTSGTKKTCNSSTEGLLYYNSTTKKYEFCNGTAWGDMTGGSSGGDGGGSGLITGGGYYRLKNGKANKCYSSYGAAKCSGISFSCPSGSKQIVLDKSTTTGSITGSKYVKYKVQCAKN